MKIHAPPLGRVRRHSAHRTLPILPQVYRGDPNTERFRFAQAVPRPARLCTEFSAARRRFPFQPSGRYQNVEPTRLSFVTHSASSADEALPRRRDPFPYRSVNCPPALDRGDATRLRLANVDDLQTGSTPGRSSPQGRTWQHGRARPSHQGDRNRRNGRRDRAEDSPPEAIRERVQEESRPGISSHLFAILVHANHGRARRASPDALPQCVCYILRCFSFSSLRLSIFRGCLFA